MEIGKKSKSGLLQKAQTVLADVTPTFANWAKRSGFIRAAILSPCSTSEGKFYYTTDAVGFSAREMALLTETQEFWMRTLSKAFEGLAISSNLSFPTFASHSLKGSAFFDGIDWIMRKTPSVSKTSVI